MRHRFGLALLALVFLALLTSRANAKKEPKLQLPDGRVIPGVKLKRERHHVVLETAFGVLRVPKAMLQVSEESETVEAPLPDVPPDALRETRSRWFVIESDLTERRVRAYHEMLDAFVDWMIGIYELDRGRVLAVAPLRMLVFRSREDFKRKQADVAPDIERIKGEGFAEGVAGFFSPRAQRIFMWDNDGAWGREHPETALHETAHWMNHLLNRARGVKFPVWFEEGTAVYFETFVPGTDEPEVNLAALATVIGAIEAGDTMPSRELRSIPYPRFRSYEYSWGWALVHFLRQSSKGRRWEPVLDHLRTVGHGAPSDSENRRFLKALSFVDDEALDQAWHTYLRAMKPAEANTPIGASADSLAAVAAIAEPTPEQAALFAKLGTSFARTGATRATVVYLQAALRGGVQEAGVFALLARALAEDQGLTVDAEWPDESLDLLRRAVDVAPLSAVHRHALGAQLLLRAFRPGEIDAARDVLGLALLLLGPNDDDKTIAKWALEGVARSMPDQHPEHALAWLLERAPGAERALRAAWVYYLQEGEHWDALIATLEKRKVAGGATFEERTTLAGLYLASDRFEDAEMSYEELLEEDAEALHLWPHYVRCLALAGKREKALAAKARALEAIDAAPQGLRYLRRAVERVRIP